MITSVKIERLRGIKEGELNNLTPLTVLVGGNGSGKSTVLEALYIGANKNPFNATSEVILRRVEFEHSHRWLIWKVGREGRAIIELSLTKGDFDRYCEINNIRNYPDNLGIGFNTIVYVPVKGSNSVDRIIRRYEGRIRLFRTGNSQWQAEFTDSNNTVLHLDVDPIQENEEIVLVDPQRITNELLRTLFGEALESGTLESSISLLQQVIPTMRRIELAPDGSTSVVHISYGNRSVPVTLSGDGISSLVHLALRINVFAKGVVLIEEPEVHQHYRTMHLTAEVIWAAIERGIQIILTTHSLEFIDALLEARPDAADINALSIVRTNLVEGSLLTRRYSGEETLLARREIQDDLR